MTNGQQHSHRRARARCMWTAVQPCLQQLALLCIALVRSGGLSLRQLLRAGSADQSVISRSSVSHQSVISPSIPLPTISQSSVGHQSAHPSANRRRQSVISPSIPLPTGVWPRQLRCWRVPSERCSACTSLATRQGGHRGPTDIVDQLTSWTN